MCPARRRLASVKREMHAPTSASSTLRHPAALAGRGGRVQLQYAAVARAAVLQHAFGARRAFSGRASAAQPLKAVADPATGELSAAERVAAAPAGFFLDETAWLAKSNFPIPPDELITKAKLVLLENFGTSQPKLLAEDFKFVAPVVGPLSKDKFVEAFSSFDLLEAFPDMKFQYHHFRVDPLEPSRVWYTARAVGTNTGKFARSLPATNKRVESPPQACSLSFNAAGACTQLTVGYVMDKQLGNTGGLGAVFGILYAMGYPLPFPEAQPWKMSWQYSAFNTGGGLVQTLLKAMPVK